MKNIILSTLVFASFAISVQAAECPTLLSYSMKPLRGSDPVDFCKAFQGKVILAVNTASQCGYTPQFKGLEALYQKYKERGLVVLGFPSNDFKQEHADPEQTATVCYLNYGVTFPMFSKSVVTGAEANAFFKQLTAQSGLEPQWNFYKYLINAEGKVIGSFPSQTTLEDAKLQSLIEEALVTAPKQK